MTNWLRAEWTAAEFQCPIERGDDDVELKSGASSKKVQEAILALVGLKGPL